MNRRLLDPFQAVELPEIIEEFLDHGTALCLAFNRRGTLLASGTKEGQVVIWDFDTRGVAAVLSGHEGPVTSVAWSRNGRCLLSGSEDQRVILWRVLDGAQVASVSLPSAVTRVSLSPRPPHLAVVSLAEGTPVVVDFGGADGGGNGSGGDGGRQGVKVEPLPVVGDGAEAATGRGGNGGGVAILSRGGEAIIGAYLRGALCVLDTSTRKILDIVRVPARPSELVLNRKGTLLLATCGDQRVRMYEVALPTRGSTPSAGSSGGGPPQWLVPQAPSEAQLAEALANKSVKSGSLLHGPEGGLLRPVRDFQNAVERTPWRSAAFSTDSEHVVGAHAAGGRAPMQLYIWNRPLGNMDRILEGPKEGALELAWHPLRSLLLCCAASGRIYVWAKVHHENWSAFAPDFKELDENTEYVEREDEFDWNTPGAGGELGPAGAGGAGEGGEGDGELAPLDVLTRERLQAFSSDEEGDDVDYGLAAVAGGPAGGRSELLYLPVVVEPEVAAPSGGEGEAAAADGGEGGDGEEADGAGAGQRGRQPAWQQQQQQQVQQQQQQQQALMMQQLQSGRMAQFPRRGGSGGSGAPSAPPAAASAAVAAAVAGVAGELGFAYGSGGGGSGMEALTAAQGGGEAVWGLQAQHLARQAPGVSAAAAEEGGGEERRRGGFAAADEEGRDTADDMDDGSGGQQPGRKRKVQFDEGALARWNGR